MAQRQFTLPRVTTLLENTYGLTVNYCDFFNEPSDPHFQDIVFHGVVYWGGQPWFPFTFFEDLPDHSKDSPIPDPAWASLSELRQWLMRQPPNRGAPRENRVGSDLVVVRHDR